MFALFQVFVLCGILLVLFGRLGLRRYLLIVAIVSMPFRVTYEFFPTTMISGWTNGLTVTIADVFMILVALLTYGEERPVSDDSLGVKRAMIGLIVACLLSMINTTWLRMTAFQVLSLVQVMLLYYIVMKRALLTAEDLRAICLGLSASLLLEGALGCLQFVSRHNFLLFSTGGLHGETILVEGEAEGTFIRVFGALGKPNAYGSLMAQLLLFNLAAMRLDIGWNFLRRAAVVLGALGLLLSFSRGAWLSALIALMVFGILLAKKQGFKLGPLIKFGFVAGVMLLPLLPYIEERLTSDDHNAAMSRIQLVSIAFAMIQAHPLFGVGTNTYPSVMRDYLPSDYSQNYVDQVHNFYLFVFAEAGFVGFLALIWLLWKLMRGAYQLIGQNSEWNFLGWGILLGMVQLALHAMVDQYHHRLGISTIFMFGALLESANRISLQQLESEKDLEIPAQDVEPTEGPSMTVHHESLVGS